jgi:hypothetical protein
MSQAPRTYQEIIAELTAERDRLKEEKRQAQLSFISEEMTNIKLVKEVERLKEIEWMYKDLCK